MRVTNETLQLAVTPIVNLRRDMANPVVVDGTQDRYPVKHPESSDGYRIHSLQGVFEAGEEGLTPIVSEVLGQGSESYQSYVDGVGDKRRVSWASSCRAHCCNR